MLPPVLLETLPRTLSFFAAPSCRFLLRPNFEQAILHTCVYLYKALRPEHVFSIIIAGQEEQEPSSPSPSSSAIDEESGATDEDDSSNNNDTDVGNSTETGAEEATCTDSDDNATDEDAPTEDNV